LFSYFEYYDVLIFLKAKCEKEFFFYSILLVSNLDLGQDNIYTRQT